jgi:hypothetical protein
LSVDYGPYDKQLVFALSEAISKLFLW